MDGSKREQAHCETESRQLKARIKWSVLGEQESGPNRDSGAIEREAVHQQLAARSGRNHKENKISVERDKREEMEGDKLKLPTDPKKQPILGRSKLKPGKRVLSRSLVLLAGLLQLSRLFQLAEAQCPWTKESLELHSDCICDFNPTSTSDLDERPVNRMSVQCSPVDFGHLLAALKQTASVELPAELTRGEGSAAPPQQEELENAGIQLASQAKIDLLHVSNSTIKRLAGNAFMIDSSSLSPALAVNKEHNGTSDFRPGGKHFLVVAIQSLHLSRCGIESVDPMAFNALEWSLTSLSLSDNLLEWVPAEPIKRLFNLKVLDLSNNRIIQLKSNSFAPLSKLSSLRLADNKFGNFRSQPAQQVPFVSDHNLTDSSAPEIDLLAFNGLESSLTDLNLKNTLLKTFPAAVKRLQKLAFLNLAQNHISQVPEGSFENMSSLTAINLERNRISHVENNTFGGVEESLSSLSLLGNLIEAFPVQQLAKLTAMRRLDLGFNQIESLPENAFSSNKQLILIALDGNPLETLPEEAFKPLQGTLRGMSIGGKSLNCDCRLSWVLRWQQEYSMQISSRERQPQFCNQPHYLRSLVSFAPLKPEHLVCAPAPSQSGEMSTDASWQSTRQASSRLATAISITPSTLTTTRYFPKLTLSELQESAATQPTLRVELGFSGKPTSEPELLGSTEEVASSSREEEKARQTTSAILTPLIEDSARPFGHRFNTPILLESSTSLPSFGGNGISTSLFGAQSLPDEDIFADEEEAGSSRKLNRHGYLQSGRPTPVLRTQSVRLKSSNKGANYPEASRRGTSTLGRHNNGTEPQMLAAVTSSDLLRQTNQTDLPAAKQNSTEPSTGKPSTQIPRIKIMSVFGNRAGEQQRNKSSNFSLINLQQHRLLASSSQATGSVVPAVPTTINIYKSTLNSSQTTESFRETPATVSKSARFVEETLNSVPPTASLERPKVAKPETRKSEQSEPYVENYTTANSNIVNHVELPTTSTRNRQPVSETDIKQRQLEIRRITEGVLASTTPETTHTTNSYSNNTRMSVSSMYRLQGGRSSVSTVLAGNSSDIQRSGTTQAPEITTLRMIGSSGAYEGPKEKPTQNPFANEDSRLATSAAQLEVPEQSFRLAANKTTPSETSRKKDAVETTTRMAATVRFVDSLAIPVTFKLVHSDSNSSKGESVRQKEASSQTGPGPSSTHPPLSSTTARPKVMLEQQAPELSLVSLKSVTLSSVGKLEPNSKQAARPAQQQSTVQVSKVQLVRKEQAREEHKLPRVLSGSVVQEQQPAVRLTVNAVQQQLPSEEAAATETPIQPRTTLKSLQGDGESDSSSANQRQARREESSASATGSLLLSRLFRLTDFDQLALVLASLLCLLILLASLTIVCVCCGEWLRKRHSARKSTNRLSFSSRSMELGGSGGRGSLPAGWFCCLFPAASRKPPSERQLLRDDSSSGGGSSGSGSGSGTKRIVGKSLLSSGKLQQSMMLARPSASQRDLTIFESIRRASSSVRKQRDSREINRGGYNFDNQALEPDELADCATKPIDHEASMELHRQAHAIDQEYFLALGAADKRTLGRRKSMFVARSETMRRQAAASRGWLGDEQGDPSATMSSVDSDKSFSPGANKNNNYNINLAHRHYLASQAASRDQIQASIFLTTRRPQRPAAKQAKSGLLKTIEGDLFELMSSDKSSTNDSRAPLNKQEAQQLSARTTMRTGRVGTFRTGQMLRSRSSGRLPELGQPPTSHFEQAGPDSLEQEDFMNSNLIPMSAEEQWPEPYLEPPEPEPEPEQADDLKAYFPSNNHRNRHHHHRKSGRRTGHSGAAEARQQPGRTRATGVPVHEEAYLANWHAVSRLNQRDGRQDPEATGQSNLDCHNLNTKSAQLVRYRSIPSLASSVGQQQGGQTMAGAANWLRWTPTEQPNNQLVWNPNQARLHRTAHDKAAGNNSSDRSNELGAGRESTVGSCWHQDNHVDTLYISSKNQM